MIKSRYLGFLLFSFMLVVFFVIPEYEGLQKPFRMALCGSFPVIYFALLIKKEISYQTLFPLAGATLLLAIMAIRGTLLSSAINAWCSMFGLFCLPLLLFDLTKERKENFRYLYLLALLSIVVQFLLFSHEDGRPKLAYQINLSSAYLLLFFVASDILGYKYGKLLVVLLSLLMITRLLIFGILIHYLVKYGKPYFNRILVRLNATLLILGCLVIVSLFSLWYTSHNRSKISYETDISRIVHLNDGSNELRFNANELVLKDIVNTPNEPRVLFGYGSPQNFLQIKNFPAMPHNELFTSVVEMGWLAVLLFMLMTIPHFNRIVSFSNLEYFIPLLFCAMILWVRYLLVPSPEMLFILFLLNLVDKETHHAAANSFAYL